MILVGMFRFRHFETHPYDLVEAIRSMDKDTIMYYDDEDGDGDGGDDGALESHLNALKVCFTSAKERQLIKEYHRDLDQLRKPERWLKVGG